MLQVRGLEVFYGPIRAVRGIDLDVGTGEIVALIGANGAGKTTTVRAIAGVTPFRGEITYEGRRLVPNSAEKNLRAGIVLVPEGRGILGKMSVEENLLMGLYSRADRAEAMADLGRMMERFPILRERRTAMASLLSGGEQQMLAIARALLLRPKLLLLDEPSFGLAPLIVQEIFGIMRRIRAESGVGILLVEQNANLALELADLAYLLETGNIVMSGVAAEIRQDEAIRRSYLGY